LRIRDPQSIEQIVSLVHDRWFDVEAIDYDAESGVLEIPFSDLGYVRTLLIGCVQSVKIVDTERVGYYDFNSISYDAEMGLVRVSTGIPLLLEAVVGGLDISVFDDVGREES